MKHLIDPPNNQLVKRLVGAGFICIARLIASNMEAYLLRREYFNKAAEEKIVLIRHGIAELYKGK